MSPARLEWLRMTRSPRGLVLTLVYLFFGFTAPLLVRYLDRLAKLGSSGVQIIAPTPKPADGIVNFVSQSSQTGMIVLVVVVAGALSYNARRGLATFYRTRAPGPFALIWPRFVAGTAVAVLAYLLGTAAAWLETGLVLGPLPAGRMLLGALPLAGIVKPVARWLPSSLMHAPAGLLTGTAPGGYLPAVVVSVLVTGGLLALATVRARHREPAP